VPGSVPGQQNRQTGLADVSTIVPNISSSGSLANETSEEDSVGLLFAGNASVFTGIWMLIDVSAVTEERLAY
jgi:hypothetical protein